jgi:hypothetical protein
MEKFAVPCQHGHAISAWPAGMGTPRGRAECERPAGCEQDLHRRQRPRATDRTLSLVLVFAWMAS